MVLLEMYSRLWVLTPRLLDITVRLRPRQLWRRLPSLFVIADNLEQLLRWCQCSLACGSSGAWFPVHRVLASWHLASTAQRQFRIGLWVQLVFLGLRAPLLLGHVGEHVRCVGSRHCSCGGNWLLFSHSANSVLDCGVQLVDFVVKEVTFTWTCRAIRVVLPTTSENSVFWEMTSFDHFRIHRTTVETWITSVMEAVWNNFLTFTS